MLEVVECGGGVRLVLPQGVGEGLAEADVLSGAAPEAAIVRSIYNKVNNGYIM
jgi:hypothetical protein